jgi:hypothetical protein
LSNLHLATAQVTEETRGRRRFWFALASDLTWETVLTEPVWYIAGENTPRALLA